MEEGDEKKGGCSAFIAVATVSAPFKSPPSLLPSPFPPQSALSTFELRCVSKRSVEEQMAPGRGHIHRGRGHISSLAQLSRQKGRGACQITAQQTLCC